MIPLAKVCDFDPVFTPGFCGDVNRQTPMLCYGSILLKLAPTMLGATRDLLLSLLLARGHRMFEELLPGKTPWHICQGAPYPVNNLLIDPNQSSKTLLPWRNTERTENKVAMAGLEPATFGL